MTWRCGSLSRSFLSAARTAPTRSSISHLHRPSSPSLRSHLLHPRRPLITLPRTLGVLGCTQSLLPLHSADAAARLTSHISVDSRACCELSQEKRAGYVMARKGVCSVAKAVAEYQYPWREKLVKYKDELAKGVWGYWELGAWKPLNISARRRARLRKEVLLAGEDWPYDPERKEMKTRRKGHKCDRISAEKRENTAKLMEKMPQMLLDYKKRRWQKKMKEEDKGKL